MKGLAKGRPAYAQLGREFVLVGEFVSCLEFAALNTVYDFLDYRIGQLFSLNGGHAPPTTSIVTPVTNGESSKYSKARTTSLT